MSNGVPKSFKVRLDVWVDDVPDEAAARRAVNRMVDLSDSRLVPGCHNNGDVDIVDVQEWDYDG